MKKEAELFTNISPLEKKLFFDILNDQRKLTPDEGDLLLLLLDEPLKNVFHAWLSTRKDQKTDIQALFEQLTEQEKAFVSATLVTDTTVGEESDKILQEAHLTHFYKKQWKKKVHDVKLRIDEAEKHGEKERVAHLLAELTALKNKMLTRGNA